VSAATAPVASRVARIALAVTFLVSAFALRQLALPGGALACSCAGEPAITGQEQAVFIGTAGQPQADGTYRFAVERWFVGGNAAAIDVMSEKQVFPDGATAINTCGLHFEAGDRMLLAATFADGVYHPGTCSPHAAVASEKGQQLLSAAVSKFGQGSSPGAPVDTPMPDDPDLTGFAIGMVGILVLVIVIGVIAAARRRREDEPAA
jgi:hypothetical protein